MLLLLRVAAMSPVGAESLLPQKLGLCLCCHGGELEGLGQQLVLLGGTEAPRQ